MSLRTRTSTAPDVNTSPSTTVQQDAPHEIIQGLVSAVLNDTTMVPIVAHGNSTLGLLLEAAQREERGVNGACIPLATHQASIDATTSSLSYIANISSSSLPGLSSAHTETWSTYRSVRIERLLAGEIMWLLGMHVTLHVTACEMLSDSGFRFFKNTVPLCSVLNRCEYSCVSQCIIVLGNQVL